MSELYSPVRVADLCDAIIGGRPVPADADAIIARYLDETPFDVPNSEDVILTLLKKDQDFAGLLAAAGQGDERTLEALFDQGVALRFITSPLTQVAFRSLFLRNFAIERLATFLRRKYLSLVREPETELGQEHSAAIASIAVQSFLTEYIYYESAQESLQVDILESAIASAAADQLSMSSVALLACYRSLESSGLVKKLRRAPWFEDEDAPIHCVMRQQIENREKERKIRASLATVTPLENDFSARVRTQYEENPYPRWTRIPFFEPESPLEVIMPAVPSVDRDAFAASDEIAILNAGCGTGMLPIIRSMSWPRSKITAVDLSSASLSYASRMAEEYGAANIEFVQGDVLELPVLNRHYDLIDCTGVLHHMADPAAGLAALIEVCRPGGLIHLGLYSTYARVGIKKWRDENVAVVKDTSARQLRSARRQIIDSGLSRRLPDPFFVRLTSFIDFYSMSMFRDLLFHVHEVSFTPTSLAEWIAPFDVDFCGFCNLPQHVWERYREFTSDDPYALDLSIWEKFERKYPETFMSMYDFILQKRGA
jgi:ubiquinone/menaquinone biosynthesis C-methylase UbiE